MYFTVIIRYDILKESHTSNPLQIKQGSATQKPDEQGKNTIDYNAIKQENQQKQRKAKAANPKKHTSVHLCYCLIGLF